jgi:hypothetical protein
MSPAAGVILVLRNLISRRDRPYPRREMRDFPAEASFDPATSHFLCASAQLFPPAFENRGTGGHSPPRSYAADARRAVRGHEETT